MGKLMTLLPLLHCNITYHVCSITCYVFESSNLVYM